MNRKAPQFELPGAREVFNLVGERAADGEHLQQKAAAAAQLAREAKETQRRCQPELISDNPAARIVAQEIAGRVGKSQG